MRLRHQIHIIAALGVCIPAFSQDTSPSLPPRPVSAPRNACLELTYPPFALRQEAEGTTQISMTVLPSGAVTNVAVAKASGSSKAHQALDKAAVKAISGCAYAEASGFSAWSGIIPIEWRLEPASESGKDDHGPRSSSESKSSVLPNGGAHFGY